MLLAVVAILSFATFILQYHASTSTYEQSCQEGGAFAFLVFALSLTILCVSFSTFHLLKQLPRTLRLAKVFVINVGILLLLGAILGAVFFFAYFCFEW